MRRLHHNKEEGIGNRQASQYIKRKWYYCACDLAGVLDGEKCSVCGRRNGSRKKKRFRYEG